jgi:hypothetical protein
MTLRYGGGVTFPPDDCRNPSIKEKIIYACGSRNSFGSFAKMAAMPAPRRV